MTRKQFEKLSVKKKRVAIAQDVLDRLAAKKFKPLNGAYSIIKGINDDFYLGGYNGKFRHDSAQEVLSENVCQVCAKGALVMSWVAQFNEKTLGEVLNRSYVEELEDIFPVKMRDAMESAFENFELCTPDGKELKELAKPWSLRKVMQNIVDNEGVFVFRGYKFGE